MEIEDDENLISDIIDEITDAACNHIFDNIIRSRVQPHTILAARDMLLDIIEVSVSAFHPTGVGVGVWVGGRGRPKFLFPSQNVKKN